MSPHERTARFHAFATDLALAQQRAADWSLAGLAGTRSRPDTQLGECFQTLQRDASALDLQDVACALVRVIALVEDAARSGSQHQVIARDLFHAGVTLDRAARDASIGMSKSSEYIPPRDPRRDASDRPASVLLDAVARAALDQARRSHRPIRTRIAQHTPYLPGLLLAVLHRAALPLVRNAVIHGIEAPTERLLVRKPRAGVVDLSVTARGDLVRLVITDDGRGLHTRTPCPRAHWSRLADAHPIGGMAQVQQVVRRLGGHGDITTWPGRGTRVCLTLPAEPRR